MNFMVRAYDCFRFLFCYLSFDRLLSLADSQVLTPRLWSQLQQQVLTIAEIKAQPPPLWNPEATRRIASRPGAYRFVADGTTGLARRPGAHRLLVGDGRKGVAHRPGAHRIVGDGTTGAHRLVADGTTGLAGRPGAHRLLVGDGINGLARRPGAHRLVGYRA